MTSLFHEIVTKVNLVPGVSGTVLKLSSINNPRYGSRSGGVLKWEIEVLRCEAILPLPPTS